jgi:hypothetical protein
VTFQAGDMGFFPRQTERWVGTGNQERLLLHISDVRASVPSSVWNQP